MNTHANPNISLPEDDLNLRDLFRVTLSHFWFIFAVVLLCMGLAGAYAFFWPPTYEAVTTVKVPDSSQSPTGMLRELVPMSGSGDPIQTYVEVCQSQSVAENVSKTLKLSSQREFAELSDQEIVSKLLKKTVDVNNVKNSNVLSITARSHDPKLASDLANQWAQVFISVNLDLSHKGAQSKREFLEGQAKEMKARLNSPNLRLNDESKADEVIYAQLLQNLQQAQIEERVNDAGIVVVDQAPIPEKPVKPKKMLSLILGLFMGLFLGLQGAFLLERIQDRVKDVEKFKLATALPNYAIIPNLLEDYPAGMGRPDPSERFNPKYLINNPIFQHAFYKESFKVLRTNLTLARADKPLKALAIFSPGPEEGKTLANSDLAIALADTGKKVLLVDADFRKSSIRKIFGLESRFEMGLPLALAGQKEWNQMTRPSGIPNLDLLPNTVTPPNPAELLGSVTMKKLIEEMKDEYDYIVFDGAPILPVTDSVVLSTLLDGVILMARFNKTRLHGVKHALEHFHRVGAKVVGTILNDVPMKRNLYGYGYGYGYGNYRYAPDEKTTEKTKSK